jgi:aldehyde dehydrogenase (NAD+)
MTISASEATVPVKHTDRFFIGGQWVTPSSDSKINVIDSHTERVYLTVAEAQAADMDRAITAAKEAFDHGPWARLTHAERAGYLRALGEEVVKRSADIAQMWPRESGVIAAVANGAAFGAKHTFDYYADLADTFEWERPTRPQRGGFGLVVKEPVGVVGAIIPWNAPMGLISMKLAPALLAGCTVVLKTSPEAPGEGYVISEAAEAVGLPAGVLNVICADRGVSELLVRDPRVDKITFTGSTTAGRRIASICGERIANDTIYGLHGAVFTNDVDRAREVGGQIRTGAVGHNGFKSDFDMGHGGFKQSGIGREGGVDGLLPFLESKAMLLDGPTSRYSDVQL